MNKIIDFDECIQIGETTENNIIETVVNTLNHAHPSSSALSYFQQISLELQNAEDILSVSNPAASSEIREIIRNEYRRLDELKQHCLFLYLMTSDKNEDEIVESIMWHIEENMEESSPEFLSSVNNNIKS